MGKNRAPWPGGTPSQIDKAAIKAHTSKMIWALMVGVRCKKRKEATKRWHIARIFSRIVFLLIMKRVREGLHIQMIFCLLIELTTWPFLSDDAMANGDSKNNKRCALTLVCYREKITTDLLYIYFFFFLQRCWTTSCRQCPTGGFPSIGINYDNNFCFYFPERSYHVPVEHFGTP